MGFELLYNEAISLKCKYFFIFFLKMQNFVTFLRGISMPNSEKKVGQFKAKNYYIWVKNLNF